ncbi:MAG: hypothetical protein K2X44_04510 [Magnetospirillum sp.]|nr:hypothetical protein [Magnetospirillum sp.]
MTQTPSDDFDDLEALLDATDGTIHEDILAVDRPSRFQRDLAEEWLRQRVQDTLALRLSQLKTERGDFTAQLIAKRLEKKKEQVSRWLRGKENMTLRTIAELFLAMECRPEMSFTPFGKARRPFCTQAVETVAPSQARIVRRLTIMMAEETIESGCYDAPDAMLDTPLPFHISSSSSQGTLLTYNPAAKMSAELQPLARKLAYVED